MPKIVSELAVLAGQKDFVASSRRVAGKKFARNIGELGIFRVLFGNKRTANAPGNINIRIAPENAMLIGRIVEVAAFVKKLDGIGKRQEAVRESRGDINLIMLLRG